MASSQWFHTEAVRQWLARRFGVDPRALAAFRIAVALVLLFDLLRRAANITAFYTDAGVLPRYALRAAYPVYHDLSIHALSGGLWWQVVLFGVAGIAALGLLVGYRTRTATLVSLGLLLSLHGRNPVVLSAGDLLLERLLFFGLFLPLGGRWSVDAAQISMTRDRIATVASAGLLLQVVVLYSANASHKLRGEKWLAGTAIEYALSLDRLVVGIGGLLADTPVVLKALTWLWLGLLSISVCLVLLTGWPRAVLVGLFVGMHLGMGLSMHLGIFPLISITALLPFLPTQVWNRVEERAPSGWEPSLPRYLTAPHAAVFPAIVRQTARQVASATLAVLVVTMVLFNVAGGFQIGGPGIDAETVQENQQWSMFAPSPPTADGWYVISGELANGSRIDPFHRTDVSATKPDTVAAHYRSPRWRRFLTRLERGRTNRTAFAAYLCRDWHGAHSTDLVSVSVSYISQPTRLHGPEPTRKEHLVTHSCRLG